MALCVGVSAFFPLVCSELVVKCHRSEEASPLGCTSEASGAQEALHTTISRWKCCPSSLVLIQHAWKNPHQCQAAGSIVMAPPDCPKDTSALLQVQVRSPGRPDQRREGSWRFNLRAAVTGRASMPEARPTGALPASLAPFSYIKQQENKIILSGLRKGHRFQKV